MPVRPPRPLLGALLVLALAGCGGAGSDPPRTGDPSPVTTVGPPSVVADGGPTAAPTTPGGFSGTDTAWLQLAIAMDERFLRVLDLVPGRLTDPELVVLAGRIAADHRAVLPRLHGLHERSGGPTTNPHEGHDMPGMATAAQLAEVRRATGRAAAELFATLARAHLDQSVRLARAEREHGTEPVTRAIAAEIERTRAGQRSHLDRLLPATVTPGP
ncbi:DUF305 domain-containing protein [Micromonospora sp. HM5-17]|jgi:hypothetical protein|uniref:DUF305 domain-containing protein n=1 Tax=Micromonospora sp. HM5-17 TaxID=2487710 RepID=UPI0013152C08|nr:DUF305 domain-containing protein [Micromonospora sp. HM5-17]